MGVCLTKMMWYRSDDHNDICAKLYKLGVMCIEVAHIIEKEKHNRKDFDDFNTRINEVIITRTSVNQNKRRSTESNDERYRRSTDSTIKELKRVSAGASNRRNTESTDSTIKEHLHVQNL